MRLAIGAGDASGGVAAERWPERRWELFALVELWALCGLTIAQPLLEITGKAPDFFLFHGAGTAQILTLIAMVTALPPLLLWALGAATRLFGGRIRRVVHISTLGALGTALGIQAGKWLLPLRGLPLALLALAVGAAVSLAYARWTVSRHLLRLSAIGPLVSVLLFVFASPASSLVIGHRAPTVAVGRAVGPHPPLVVIFFDEFPQLSLLDDSGKLDARRFPNFARLAASSTWYRDATTVSGSTTEAIPSMLTGRYSRKKVAPHYSQHPRSLFTLLADNYDFRVHESVLQLCPPTLCARTTRLRSGLPALLGESAALLERVVSPLAAERSDPAVGYVEPIVPHAGERHRPASDDVRFRWKRRNDNQPVRFQQFVAGLRPSARPTLHFLHLLLPHQPFRFLPSGTQYPHYRLDSGDPWIKQLWRQRHLLQVQYVDSLLGVALDRLHESGLYDDAMVLVTADHGMSFDPATRTRTVEATQRNAAEIAWVPLFIKEPGQREGRVDLRNWQHVDLLPTVADYAGMEVPWRVHGVSAGRQARADATKRFFNGKPGKLLALDSAKGLATVLDGPDALPYTRPQPLPHLIGKAVADLPVRDSGIRAGAANRAEFENVRPEHGMIPALVHGDLPARVPAGKHVAIAVNGVIGAVVPVLPKRPGAPRFAGVVTDETLFRSGANRLELFLVAGAGGQLQRLSG